MIERLMQFKREDFTLTFESSGTSFIFEDIVNSYYMVPFGESISLCNRGRRVYVSNKIIESLRTEGTKRTTDETIAVAQSFLKYFEHTVVRIEQLNMCAQVTKEDLREAILNMQMLLKTYLYFDPWYWDTVYEKSKTDKTAKKQVELIQEYKNLFRNKLEQIFFDDGSYLVLLVQKLATQFGIPAHDLEWYREKDIHALFDTIYLAQSEIEKRKNSYVLYVSPSRETMLFTGEASEKFIAQFDRNVALPNGILKGTVAHSIGKVIRGHVRVIQRNYGNKMETQRQMDEMQQGEILVSETTDPELIPAFKKASAVVTDIGGLLSHAAITSREMNISCIVGTGNASKVLKTGDFVEVDADREIVTILESK